MRYLELVDLLAIASEVLGLEVDVLVSVTDLGLAESAVSRPQAGFAGQEQYPAIHQKAASMMWGIARNHAFIDGNKRVAVLAALEFLNLNSYDLDLEPPEDVDALVRKIAAGAVEIGELADWILGRMSGLADG
ncbi:MAG: type II toxin-antitoxin system death-on-curing family toxin [Dehalococcoidia bacterium]